MSILDELFDDNSNKTSPQSSSLFKDDNLNGFFAKGESGLLKDIRVLKNENPGALTHIGRFFEHTNLKHKFARLPQVSHENGRTSIWCRFKYGNSISNVAVPAIPGMQELIEAYAYGRVTINVTFRELLQQAAGEI